MKWQLVILVRELLELREQDPPPNMEQSFNMGTASCIIGAQIWYQDKEPSFGMS